MPKRNADPEPATITDDTTKTYGPGDFAAAVGMEAEDASAWIGSQGFFMRITRVNGHSSPTAADVKPQRVNVAVQDNKVVSIISLG
jgi:hypothetical protein